MNKRLKTKWVKALRSGKYSQARGTLKNFNLVGGEKFTSYCCLGVLKEIEPKIRRSSDKELLGPSCGIDIDTQYKLAAMNDGLERKQKSFRAIATWIEKNL
jgi:hypothetical protein